MATLLDHAIGYGGTFSDPIPTETNITINSLTSTFIMVSYAADALQGQLDPFSDSEGNVWNRLTFLGTPPYFPFTSATASFYWIGGPSINTSATHTFTFQCIAGSGHAVIQVMAWGDMENPAFPDELWTQTGLSTLTVGPATIPAGIAFAVAAAGADPATAGEVQLTTPGWTILDSLPATRFVTDFGHCGMTVGYKVYDAITPGVTNDWTNLGTFNFMGAGIFQLTFTQPTPPPPIVTINGCVAALSSGYNVSTTARLLQENSGFILLEDGGELLLESSDAPIVLRGCTTAVPNG